MAALTGYTVRQVSQLLELSPGQVRSWVRSGFLDPDRGPRNELRFSFRDLVLLRTAQGLVKEHLPPNRVRSALARLKEQLPSDRPLTGVQIRSIGGQVVVRDGIEQWEPESGQGRFDFDVAELARSVEPLSRPAPREPEAESKMTAEDWFELGAELESVAPLQSRDAYRRSLELDPEHIEARLNIGRLLMDDGQLTAAETHFRLAQRMAPEDPVPAYNRGSVLEVLGRLETAAEAFRRAIHADPEFRDAYVALARVLERAGDQRGAVRTLSELKQLDPDRR